MTEPRLVSTWEAITKDDLGEAHVHTLHKYDHTTPEETPDFINTAAPTIIRPSRRVKPTREASLTMFIGDTQHPFQDDRALDLAQIAIRELMPDTIVFMGDDIDAPNFSTFAQKQEWAGSLQRGLDQFHERLARVRADAPDADIIVHQGNHDVRLERMIRAYNGDLLGLRRANAENELSVLALSYLLRLEELGAQYISGYPNAEFWHEDHFKSFHGTKSNSSGSTMSRVIMGETVSCAQGHSHNAEIIYRTLKVGRKVIEIFGLNPGAMVDFARIPSGKHSTDERGREMTPNHNWQKTVGLVWHNPEMAAPMLLPINQQGIHIAGKVYQS